MSVEAYPSGPGAYPGELYPSEILGSVSVGGDVGDAGDVPAGTHWSPFVDDRMVKWPEYPWKPTVRG